MPRVYISAEDPAYDYSAAYQHGDELIGVFPPGQITLHPQHALQHARKVMQGFKSDDLLLCSGDPVKIGICFVVARERSKTLKILRFNRHSQSYMMIPVDFAGESTLTKGELQNGLEER